MTDNNTVSISIKETNNILQDNSINNEDIILIDSDCSNKTLNYDYDRPVTARNKDENYLSESPNENQPHKELKIIQLLASDNKGEAPESQETYFDIEESVPKQQDCDVNNYDEDSKVGIYNMNKVICILKIDFPLIIKNDYYCWLCHSEGDMICCDNCPRVYHKKCLNSNIANDANKNGEDDKCFAFSDDSEWTCPECIVSTICIYKAEF